MLFAPQSKQRIWEPAAVREELMDDSVAGGTEGDQPFFLVDPGFSVMNGGLVPCPATLEATLAAESITPEHLVP